MGKTILIVDDSPSIREAISSTLEDVGFDICIGENGLDAQKHLAGGHLDLIITDLHMPEVNGIELIKVVRENPTYQYTPVLLLTTESQASMRQDAKAAGATGWLVKPFEKQKLLAVIKKVIR